MTARVTVEGCSVDAGGPPDTDAEIAFAALTAPGLD